MIKKYDYDENDSKSIEQYAQQLVNHTFNDINKLNLYSTLKEDEFSYGNKSRKGGLGNFIEEKFFGYKANSDSNADFNEAGVELKVTPYEIKKNGKLSAGERLVLTMISYDKPIEPDFLTSHLWKKCRLILLIYYLRDKSIKNNMDYLIKYVKLFTPPQADLEIIIEDYKKITEKIAQGNAHLLSEGDTMYLGACTKGATAEKSTVPQAYYAPDIKARKRAFCFKTSYMTYVLNNYIVSNDYSYESIIKDSTELKNKSFEEIITSRIDEYIGKTDRELCEYFGEKYTGNKAQWTTLSYRMLGIKSNRAEEFAKAQIVVKTICLEANGTLKESSPLPPLVFNELINEEWENSTLYEYLNETKFLFVVFQKDGDKRYLKGCQLWHIPYDDLNMTVKSGWESIKNTVIKGILFEIIKQKNGDIIKNNLPKKSDNKIIHIRPHTQQTYYVLSDGKIFGKGRLSDSDLLPDGRRMTKQSFWLNNTYIVSQLKEDLK